MIYNTIQIEITGQRDIQGITLTSGDVNYGLIFEFKQNGQPFDITGYNLAIYAKLTGLDTPIPDVGTVSNGKGYYIIKPSMYAYGGETQLEIVLTDNTSSHITTKVLHCPVRSGFSASQPISEADYSVLSTLIQQAQAATTNANNAASYVNGKVEDYEEHMDDTDIHVTTEDKTAWNGAVEDLGEFYGGKVVADVIETTTKEGVYMLTNETTEKTPLLVTTLYSDGTLTTKLKAKQIIPLISDRLLEQYWNGSIWTNEYYAYLSDLTPILADIVALYGKFLTGTKTATSTGTAGQMSYDDNYFYVCTATNTWIRFAKTAW